MTPDDLSRLASRAGAELHLGDGRAWVVAVGTIDTVRASALADLIDELAAQPSFHRVSVDLTCTVSSDQGAWTILETLRVRAVPWVDVTTPGPIIRHLPIRHAA